MGLALYYRQGSTGTNSYYPPLIPLAFSLAYGWGVENPKIIITLLVLSFVLVFHRFVKSVAGALSAHLATLLLFSVRVLQRGSRGVDQLAGGHFL